MCPDHKNPDECKEIFENRMCFTVQLSRFFLFSVSATASLDYHTLIPLSTTFFIFSKFIFQVIFQALILQSKFPTLNSSLYYAACKYSSSQKVIFSTLKHSITAVTDLLFPAGSNSLRTQAIYYYRI